MQTSDLAQRLSELFSGIYFYCHPEFEVELSHQAVRVMQFISMSGPATVQDVSQYLGIAHNTASEIVRRLRDKELVVKRRRQSDERVVELSLTEEGQRTVLQHTGLDIESLTKALDGMSQEDRSNVLNAFGALFEAIGGEA